MSEQSSANYKTPRQIPDLGSGDVHLWRTALIAGPQPGIEEARALLSEDELERANRFRGEADRTRFTLRRAFLRDVLSRYTDMCPKDLTFTYGEMGKPQLGNCPDKVEFNQSDSRQWTVVAVCREAVGVDIEAVRPDTDIQTLASEVFTDREREELESVPQAGRRRAFFQGWTRKEAVIKALGSGLAYPLQDIDVSMSPGVEAKLLRLGDQLLPAWSIVAFTLDRETLGAIAVPESRIRLQEIAEGLTEFGIKNS